MCGIPGAAALAGRIPLSSMPEHEGVAYGRRSLVLRWMRATGFGHGRHGLRSHPYASGGMVRGGLVRDEPETRASALGLQRVLGFGSYQTAWAMLHKLRTAMVRPGRDGLKGEVEVDETFVGGVAHGGKRGRGAARKSIVVIAVEVLSPKGFGRVRMRRVPNASGASLVPFLCDVVEPGSTVLTDGWRGYDDLFRKGYTHRQIAISATGDPAHVSLPAVHRVASLLKRWLLGTHQGSVDPVHLQAYLDEFTFRFNRRSSRRRGMLFYRLLELAVGASPAPYRTLVGRPRRR